MKKEFFDFEVFLNKIWWRLSYYYTKSVASKLQHAGQGIFLTFPSRVTGHGNITIGEKFHALEGLRLEAITLYHGMNYAPALVIGDRVQFHDYVHIGCINKVFIGNDVLFAGKIFVSDHAHGYLKDTYDVSVNHTDQPLSGDGFVIVEDNCWIGEGCAILPNARIGRGSVIGANSVVIGEIEPYSIAAGAPARVIRRYNFANKLWERVK